MYAAPPPPPIHSTVMGVPSVVADHVEPLVKTTWVGMLYGTVKDSEPEMAMGGNGGGAIVTNGLNAAAEMHPRPVELS